MFANLLYTVSAFSALLPLLTGIFIGNRLGRSSRILLVLMLFAAVSQLNAWFNTDEHERWMIFNLYSITDAAIWSFIFFRNSNKTLTRLGIGGVFLLQLSVYFVFIYHNGISGRFFYEFVCLNSFVQLIWVLAFFYERYKSDLVHSLIKEPMFWFCLGLLVYCPTTYFLFVYYKVVRMDNTEYGDLWSMHSLVNTFMYIIFTMGMYVNIKRISTA
jgi:hypothetical protein